MKDLPIRKNNRLKNYDYSQAGCYFITICVKDGVHLFGQIVGDAALGVPYVVLSSAGEMIKTHIENINQQKGITLDRYVIMPNHVHLLIGVKSGMLGMDGTPRAASPTKATIPLIVNALKGLTSKQFGETIWQRSYHDRIVRDEEEYQRILQYINENPARWREDRFYTVQVLGG
ncbi:MAG: transposase [Clostridia bacterium]|nr:transposase [Clostridia bacterium]